MTHEKKTSKFIRIVASEIVKARVKEMSIDLGVSQAEVLRAAINEKYEKFSTKRFGYGTEKFKQSEGRRGVKSARDSQVEAIKSMDAQTLQDYLFELGYFPPDKTLENGFVERHRIVTDNVSGLLRYDQFIDDLKSGEHMSERQVFSIDELISDLRKEKKI